MATPREIIRPSAYEVLREHHSKLYWILIYNDTCRNFITTELYSKDIITEGEYDRIKQLREQGARSTDEILKLIEKAVRDFPTKVDTILEILGTEEILKPTVTSIRNKLQTDGVPTSQTAVSPPFLMSVDDLQKDYGHTTTEQGTV